MPTQLQFRRGTTSQNNGFTGAVGEITVDTDTDALVLHDGSTAGGIEIVPAGTIVAFGGSSIPTGYLACNDQAVSRTTYARLFAAISTSYGTGDGSSTFNVPDLRDRAPLGAGTNNSLGAVTAGAVAASAVMTSATKSGHTTATNTTGSTTQTVTTTTATFATSAKDSSQATAVTAVNTAAHTHSIPALTIDDFTIDTTLPSCVVNFMIKT